MTDPDWPFEDPPNVAVMTTRSVLDGEDWIGLVTHDEDDGSWQVLPLAGVGDGDQIEIGRVIALSEACEIEPRLRELADLPLGWRAWRESPDSPWVRELSPHQAG